MHSMLGCLLRQPRAQIRAGYGAAKTHLHFCRPPFIHCNCKLAEQNSAKMALGEYPPEYNPRVHGTYDPGRYYGKPDTKFGQVKLGELGAWLSRRNKSPTAIASAVSRAWWRWNHRYIMPWNAGIGGPMQFIAGAMLFFYVINYPKYRKHRHYKYHY